MTCKNCLHLLTLFFHTEINWKCPIVITKQHPRGHADCFNVFIFWVRKKSLVFRSHFRSGGRVEVEHIETPSHWTTRVQASHDRGVDKATGFTRSAYLFRGITSAGRETDGSCGIRTSLTHSAVQSRWLGVEKKSAVSLSNTHSAKTK